MATWADPDRNKHPAADIHEAKLIIRTKLENPMGSFSNRFFSDIGAPGMTGYFKRLYI